MGVGHGRDNPGEGKHCEQAEKAEGVWGIGDNSTLLKHKFSLISLALLMQQC